MQVATASMQYVICEVKRAYLLVRRLYNSVFDTCTSAISAQLILGSSTVLGCKKYTIYNLDIKIIYKKKHFKLVYESARVIHEF